MRLAACFLLALGLGLAVPGAVAAGPSGTTIKAMFVQPVVLRGTLGGEPIQVTLRTKQEFEDGIEGQYFYFGRSLNILLAGEIEGDALFLEESENGTDVSGHWDGTMSGDVIRGEWQSPDGKRSRPFELRILRAGVRGNPAASR